jgi:hypothetical protein
MHVYHFVDIWLLINLFNDIVSNKYVENGLCKITISKITKTKNKKLKIKN